VKNKTNIKESGEIKENGLEQKPETNIKESGEIKENGLEQKPETLVITVL
jgi:hypothetical protein